MIKDKSLLAFLVFVSLVFALAAYGLMALDV